MSRLVTKFLLEILLGFQIMEPISKRKRRRRWRTTTRYLVLRRNGFLGCYSQKLEERANKRHSRKRCSRKEQCIVMHKHVTCRKECIMGKNLIQTIALTIYKQSHNPRMHKHVNKMLKHGMHDMLTYQQNPTQKFSQKHKHPNIFHEIWKLRSKCMKGVTDEENKRLRPLTKGFKLGRGWNLEGKKVFGGFGLREKKERLKCLSEKWTRSNLKYIWI